MTQPPKKRKRKLPKNIVQRPDAEALEIIFGKRVKRELDRQLSGSAEGVGGKDDKDSIHE